MSSFEFWIPVVLAIAAGGIAMWRHRRGAPARSAPIDMQPATSSPPAGGPVFLARRDIQIQYFLGEEQVMSADLDTPPLRVLTSGLAQRGRPEFELLEVPASLNNEAAHLLNDAADYTMNRRELRSGDTWAVRQPEDLVVAAKIQAVESFGQRVLRICDLGDERCEQPARTAVCARGVAFARAKVAIERREEAVDVLKELTAWFPGEPGADVTVNNGENINQNNNLAYLTLAVLGVDAQANYEAALARSDAAVRGEYGGVLPQALPRDVLERDAHAIVVTLLDEMGRLDKDPQHPKSVAPGIMMHLAPVLEFSEDNWLVQRLAIGPALYRSYFYEAPVRDRLRDPRIAELAASVYAKSVDVPALLLIRSRETLEDVYELSGGDPMVRPTPQIATDAPNYHHLPALSRILASFGRELAAGLSFDELAARWDVTAEPALQASAEHKLAALRERETHEIARAYAP